MFTFYRWRKWNPDRPASHSHGASITETLFLRLLVTAGLKTSSSNPGKKGVRSGWELRETWGRRRHSLPPCGLDPLCSAMPVRLDRRAHSLYGVKEGSGTHRGRLAPLLFCFTIKPAHILNSKIKRKDHKDWYYPVLQKAWGNAFLYTVGMGVNGYYFFLRFYLFIFRQRGRVGEKEGEKHPCVVASHLSRTGDPACNPGMCPWLGIELATLWFTGQRSIHWATPARAYF